MDRGSEGWFNQCARPVHRTGPAGDFCFRDRAANISQHQISNAFLGRISEDVIMVFQSCLIARAEPDRGIIELHEFEFW